MEKVDKDKRTGWLRELKVGDKIYVNDAYLHTVDRITPTGMLEVDGRLYTSNGRFRGQRKKMIFHRSYLSEYKPDNGGDTSE